MVTSRRQPFIVTLVAGLLLAGCGGAPAAPEPTTAPEPTARPTSTPRPTPKPKPTAEPEPTSAPVSDGGLLRDVEVGTLQTYTHAAGLFTLDVPDNWTIKDTSKPGEAIVIWTDPAENAFIQVDIFENPDAQNPAALAGILKNYLQTTFSKQLDFAQEKAKESGPSQLIVWSYTAQASSDVRAEMLGNSFIKQIGNKISLFTLVVPNDQFDRLKGSLDSILGSYVIDDAVALSEENNTAGAAQVEIGSLSTYTYSTGVFSIDVPDNWVITDNSKPGEAIVLWSAPGGRATIVVDIFAQPGEQSQDELVEFLRNFLTKTFGQEDGFHIDDPKPQSDGSVLLVYSFTDAKLNIKALGNSFIEQRGDKISILSTVVPDEEFDQLLPKTNEIIQSYSIDSSAGLP